MILGMSLTTFTNVHVALSLIAIFAGLVVAYGFSGSKRLPRWTALFLGTSILTSATGFLFPFTKLLPSHVVGVISLVVLAFAIVAYYPYRLAGPWRSVYLGGALAALYLNVFVGVVQAFLKIVPLNHLAPTQSELPFVVVQAAVLLGFVALFVWALRVFRPQPLPQP